MGSVQRGFTLIELILVIVILGILAAFALPKFANLGHSASQAVFDGHVGAIRSAIKLYHLKWRASGQPVSSVSIYISIPSVSGYPAGGGILTKAYEGDCQKIWGDMLEGSDSNLPNIKAASGWSATTIDNEWARNASPIGSLGEAQDLYCHFVYTGAYYGGGFSGTGSELIPALQYNISSGQLNVIDWPFPP